MWGALEPATRTFLASGEAVFRTRRDDPAFDFSGPAVEYAKAVETELNALLFPALRKVYAGKAEAERSVFLDGRTLDLGQRVPPQSLGAMLVLLEKKPVIEKGVRRAFSTAESGWIPGELPHALRRIVEIRNPAAHGKKTSKDEASARRAEILGIGQEGVVVRMGRVGGGQ